MPKAEYTNPHSGSSFTDFLEEQGIREEVEATAIARVLAWQRDQAALTAAPKAHTPDGA